MSSPITPQECAQKCADIMFTHDAASKGLGISIETVGPGRAVLTMEVTGNMLNGHGICHGGFIFTLADSAFAFACNSYNQLTVAQQNQITYVAPAVMGDVLTANAHESARAGRSGTYDVTVTNASDKVIALFRGLSRQIKGQHFPDNGDTA